MVGGIINSRNIKTIFFLKILFIFREGKGGTKRGRETSMCGCLVHAPYWGPAWPTTQACALTGDQTSNPLIRRLALNPLNHTSQGKTLFLKSKYHDDKL